MKTIHKGKNRRILSKQILSTFAQNDHRSRGIIEADHEEIIGSWTRKAYMVTFLLALLAIAGVSLMLYSAVALIQDKRLFGSAPKEALALIKPKPERFKGQHILGWFLLIIALLMLLSDAAIAVYDGVNNGFGFWRFFVRFLIILYAYKAYDMFVFDFLLLTRSHFFQHYFPEVDQVEAFHKYGFNLKSQIIRIIVYPFACALMAGVCD